MVVCLRRHTLLSFYPFALFDDGGCPAEVDIGGRDVVQALVVSLMVAMLDEGLDLLIEIAGQEVVFQEDTVLQGLVPSLDLALGLRMARGTAYMVHAVGLDVVCQFSGDVAELLSLSSFGLCSIVALSRLEAASARASVSVTSSTPMLVHNFQVMM